MGCSCTQNWGKNTAQQAYGSSWYWDCSWHWSLAASAHLPARQVPCLLCPGFLEDLPPILQMFWRMHVAIMRHIRFSSFTSKQVSESLSVLPKVSKGALHRHAALDQDIVEVFLLVVQLYHIGVHEPGLEQVSWVSDG